MEQEHQHPEAEARFTIESYYKGFKILLTLPYDFKGSGVITGIIDKMVEAGFSSERTLYKAPEGSTQSQPDKEKPKEPEGHLCPLHGVEMKKYEKNGHSWYSHQDNGGWCNGRAKK
jgi:hypothetical protein